MREIEFRIKHGTEGKWVYGYPVFYEDGSFTFIDKEPLNRLDALEMCEISSAYDRTLGQFTGLKDKNGVKVYEGDIVRVYTDCEYYVEKGYHNGVIIFDDEYFFDYQVSFEHIHNSCSDYLGNHRDDIEVVGNVYDNPELIKERE